MSLKERTLSAAEINELNSKSTNRFYMKVNHFYFESQFRTSGHICRDFWRFWQILRFWDTLKRYFNGLTGYYISWMITDDSRLSALVKCKRFRITNVSNRTIMFLYSVSRLDVKSYKCSPYHYSWSIPLRVKIWESLSTGNVNY